MYIPVEKLKKAQQKLDRVQGAKRLQAQELRSLSGLLNFLCKAFYPGRTFLRRLYDTIGDATGYWSVYIPAETKKDLRTWRSCMSDARTRVAFRDLHPQDAQILDWYTDAAGNPELGMGGVFGSKWFSLQWPKSLFKLKPSPSIGFLELYAVLMSLFLWGKEIANRRVQLWSDNMSVVQVVNSMTSKDKRMMTLIRILVQFTIKLNTKITMRHVPGVENIKADLLSRLQVDRFKLMFGNAMDPFPSMEVSKIWPYTPALWMN